MRADSSGPVWRSGNLRPGEPALTKRATGRLREPERPGRKRRIEVAATVSTLGTLIGLVFIFFPDLQPRSGGCPGPVAATLSRISVEVGTTWRHYVAEVNLDVASYPDDVLETRGAILHYTASLKGYRGKPVSLRWSLYDAATGAPLRGPFVTNQIALELTPRSCDENAGQPIWIHTEKQRGRIHARIFVYDGSGLLRDSQVTEPFPVVP